MPDIRLTTSKFVRPGVYIGRVFTPQPVAITGTPRMPSYVGVGNRLARESNSRHIRSRIYNEQLTFSLNAPYVAYLDYNAMNDRTLAILRKASGEPVPFDKWLFVESESGSGVYDMVVIEQTTFDKTATYYIEYQSTERTPLDTILFDDLRAMLYVGDSEGLAQYIENVDYRVVTHLTGDPNDTDALLPGAGNTQTGGAYSGVTFMPAGGGTGNIGFTSGTSYRAPYTRIYELTCTGFAGAVPNRTANFNLRITAQSGGNDQIPNIPFHTLYATIPNLLVQENPATPGFANNVELDAAPNYPVTGLPDYYDSENDGVHIDFAFGGGNFAIGDVFRFTAFGPGMIEFSSAHDNDNQWSEVETPVENSGNTTSGKITVNSRTEFDDEYDRQYYFQVTNIGVGVAPNRTAQIRWCGINEIPFTEGTIDIQEANPTTTMIAVDLERDIYLDFAYGAEHAFADGVNVITQGAATTLNTAINLANEILTVWNNHDNNGGGGWHSAGWGNHQITAAAAIDLPTLITLSLDIYNQYQAHLADAVMHGTVADTIWTLENEVTATSSLAQIVSMLNELRTKYPRHRVATNFVVGDSWLMQAKAPRRDYAGKDDRNYAITINSVVPDNSVTFTWNSLTPEGNWGQVTLAGTGAGFPDTKVDLPDDVRLMFRNLEPSAGGPPAPTIYGNDTFSFAAINDNQIDWSLTQRSSQTIAEDDITQDVAGNVTGFPLTYFLVLDSTPTSVLRVKEADSGDPISYTWITDTPYIMFATDPAENVVVDYEFRGNEPDPGNSYFVTANRKRLDAEFDTPIRYLTVEEARLGLYPSSTENHLWMMAEIAFETEFFGCYTVMVRSAADNNPHTTNDYRRAIDATETKADITDLVVLSHFASLGYSKSSIETENDPFVAHERLLWVGPQTGTQIGDAETPNTLVYLARTTLQFSPNSPGKGNVILLGNTSCTKTFTLEDGTSTVIPMDGSFIAGYTAALTASFNDPALTILRRDCTAFDTMQTWNEKEEELVGGASITFLSEVGTAIYRYNESVTVDTTEVALNEISARTQEHYVVRRVRNELDTALIGLVPPSPLAGQIIVQDQLVKSLGGIAAENIIAPYGSELNPPQERPIDPSNDVVVFVDEIDQRLYHFKFFFNTRLPIKRLFGLYSVNTKFWSSAASGVSA